VLQDSGSDRNGQQLGCPDPLGNELTIGLQPGNVNLGGLHGSSWVRSLLGHCDPAQLPERPYDLPAGDPR